MLSFISNCIIDQVSEILLEAIVAASEEQEQTVSFADTVSCKILSNSVLRSVFEIKEQISSTCFIDSKGLISYRRQLTPVPSLGSVIIRLILLGKIIPRNESYWTAQDQHGCCTGDGFHSLA